MSFIVLLSLSEIELGCIAIVALGLFVFVLIQPYLRRIGK